MNTSIQHIINAVIASLETQVLPHLEPAATPASNVRACLMMLVNIEQRVTLEAGFLFEDNKSLRALLKQAVESGVPSLSSDALGKEVKTALAKYPDRSEFFDAAEAAIENRAYQELLTQLIKQLGSNKSGAGFKPALHQYLEELKQRDAKLVEKALGRVPV